MRNSSLVEWLCAENVTGLKFTTEALAMTKSLGRGAFYLRRSRTERYGGADRRENAGMSKREKR